jgi:hypothetical protein
MWSGKVHRVMYSSQHASWYRVVQLVTSEQQQRIWRSDAVNGTLTVTRTIFIEPREQRRLNGCDSRFSESCKCFGMTSCSMFTEVCHF